LMRVFSSSLISLGLSCIFQLRKISGAA